ncbi:MAG: flagellar assembly protein FliH [Candidatus Krumholzibacteriia bacterium]|jgi:flagellar assembly protein FliH
MQKWSPDEFTGHSPSNIALPLADAEFLAEGKGAPGEGVMFRREAGFTDTKSLMSSLTNDERAQLYDLVALELADDYSNREAELKRDYDRQLQLIKKETAQQLDIWSDEIVKLMADQLKDAAAASARLGKQIAEKIVRKQVAVDPDIVARVIETTLFKIIENTPLTIQVNPTDAAWLEDQADFLNKLNISQIISDRRIDQGGCVVRNTEREWDATLSRQLETLDEIVAEMIASGSLGSTEFPSLDTTEKVSGNEETEVDDVPSVD